MYIGMKDLVSIHRHVKTVKGLDLSKKQMDELRNALMLADDKKLAPNNVIIALRREEIEVEDGVEEVWVQTDTYLIKQCVVAHKAGSRTTTITVAANA